jgi:hypothetical protein
LLELLIGIVLVDLPAQCEQINQRAYASNASRKEPKLFLCQFCQGGTGETEHTKKANKPKKRCYCF